MKKRMTLHEKAMEAMKIAVKNVVLEHKKSGRPLAIWKNGRVALVSAKKISARS